MTFLISLLGAGALTALIGGITQTRGTQRAMAHLRVSPQLPKAFDMLFVTAELSELTRVVQHVSMVHIAATLLLFGVWRAMKAGAEDVSRIPS